MADPIATSGTPAVVNNLTLKVLSDGTANSDGSWDASDAPGFDSSPNNGIVRTHDFVVYQWGYAVASAGDAVLTQVLPDGMGWVAAESTTACAEGAAAVSADRRTLTCTRANQSTGATTYQVKAEVLYGSNGQVMSTSLASAGVASSAPAAVTISAAPNFRIGTASNGQGFVLGGADGTVPGYYTSLMINVYQAIDPIRGVRGSEPLQNPFTLTMDPSGQGANAALRACGASSGPLQINGRISPTAPATSAVPYAGTWTCSQAVPGGPISITVKDAITDIRSYPTQNTSGAPLAADRAQVTFGTISTWMPTTDYPTSRYFNLSVSGFDPNSASGQSNFGAGYAPGQEPGASLASGVNSAGYTIVTSEKLSASMNRVYAGTGTPDYSSPLPPYTNGISSGLAPMLKGQTLQFGGFVTNQSGAGSSYTNVMLCGTWDETAASITAPFVSNVGFGTVEYAHLPMASDADRRAANCGTPGDGDVKWSTSIDGAGGAGLVNAVRATLANPLDVRLTSYQAVKLTRTSKDLATGTPIAVFWQQKSDQTPLERSSYNAVTNNTQGLGSRALAAGASVSNTISWDGASTSPGTVHALTVQPVVAAGIGGAPTTAQNTSVAITMPSQYATVVANSWPAGMDPTITTDGFGVKTYTFALGDLSSSDVIPPLVMTLNVAPRTSMPATLTATTVISSDSDLSNASSRTASAGLVVNAPAAFNVTKTADASYAIPDVPFTYTLGWINGLDESVGTGKLVDVMPYNGDGRGTSGLNGLAVTGVAVEADMATAIEYTTAPSAAVMASVRADRSGDTLPGGWTAWPSSGPAPAGVTALRFITGEIAAKMSGQATISVVPGTLSLNGAVVNDVSGVVTKLDQPVSGVAATELTSGAAQLAGNVYKDLDYSWTKSAGDTNVSGVVVRVTGYAFGANGVDDLGVGDDRIVTAADNVTVTTDASGNYVFDGMAPGRWTVSVDTSTGGATGLRLAQQPSAATLHPTDQISGLDFGLIDPVPAPVVVNDAVRVSAGDTVQIPVLGNDTLDPSATINAVSSPSSGSVSIDSGAKGVTYTAASTGSGVYTFTYTVIDKARQSATATVTVTVVPLPSAAAHAYSVKQDATTTITDLLAGSTGDAVQVTGVAAASHGTVSRSGNVAMYAPSALYYGPDSFTYTLTDSMGKTSTATVSITVVRAPVAADDSVWAVDGVAKDFSVLANDPFTSGSTLAIGTAPGHGNAVVSGGVVSYTATSGFEGTDSFTYTLTDSLGQTASAVVTVRVVKAISANPDTARTAMATAVSIDVLANDAATTPTITGITNGAKGSVAIDSGQVVYTPAAGESGTDTFTYTVTDAVGQTATANVTVTIVAQPTADDVALRTGVDTAIESDLSAHVAGDAVVGSVGAQGSHGTAVLSGKTLTYTPAAGFFGTDEVTIVWTDSVGQTASSTVTIEVVDGPVANNASAQTRVATPVTIDVLSGSQGDAIEVDQVLDPMFGTAVIGVGGEITYTPNAGYSGDDSFTFVIKDSVGQTASATVTVRTYAVPVPPELARTIGVGTAVAIDPARETPAAGTGAAVYAPWEVTAVDAPAHGQALLDADGVIHYAPEPGFSGVDAFSYTVTDSLGQQAQASITVTVQAVTLEDLSAQTAMNTPVTIDVLAKASGVGVALTSVSDPTHGVATIENGHVVYTPADGYYGPDTFTVSVTDDLGQVATATVTVAVEAPGPDDPDDPGAIEVPVSGGGADGAEPVGITVFGLPLTGADSIPTAIVAALALGLGTLLLVVMRRRRRTDES